MICLPLMEGSFIYRRAVRSGLGVAVLAAGAGSAFGRTMTSRCTLVQLPESR